VDIKEIKIDKIIAGGDGLGFLDGKAHFVPQSLPGELIEIEVVESKKSFNRCKVINIIKPSEYRQTPFCSLYDECGGCNMQYTTYGNQITIKKDMVKDIFLRNGKIFLEDFDFFESVSTGYRNRVQFHISGDIIGFKKRQSNKIIPIKKCPLLVHGLNDYLLQDHTYDSNRVTVFSDGIKNYVGGLDKDCVVSIQNKDIIFNPCGFFQSNLSILPTLINHLNSFILGTSIMDLYCGVGLFSSFLPENITDIVAVEMDKRVKPFIEKNLGSRAYSFHAMSLEDYINRGLHKKHSVDTIIVDPPRVGLSSEVRDFLTKSDVKRIIYISCDPTTMARDVFELKNSGYSLTHFSCFDFYPNTNHVEAFGVLDLV
jgi:23S rRNA (uracil1939-C5)-methyltransferase